MIPSPLKSSIPWHATPPSRVAALHTTDPAVGLGTNEATFRHGIITTTAWRHALGHARLCALAAGKTTVLRDGQFRELPIFEVVAGDIILMQPGDLVPADARLILVRELFCDESELTGLPIAGKSVREVAANAPLTRRHSMIFCGSKVLHGSGRAIVVATGLETEMGRRLTAGAQAALGQSLAIHGESPLANTRE
jgi:magnesium-transporting ATPase (P-type)